LRVRSSSVAPRARVVASIGARALGAPDARGGSSMRARRSWWGAALVVLATSCARPGCGRESSGDPPGKPDPIVATAKPSATSRPPPTQPPPPAPSTSASAPPATTDCAAVPKNPKDPGGYLEKICRYLVKTKLNVAPGVPNAYRIDRIDASGDTIRVYLNCCYMGDVATIDKKTGEVTGFEPGAM
jgi:hypothetical protein